STDGTARVFELDKRPRIFPSSELEHRSPTGRTKTPFVDGEWTAWAQLCSGRQISSNEQITPVPTEALRKLWVELRKKSPRSFESSELSAWHSQAAQACEKSRDWFGAEFHWKRALALQPGEERFRAGCERAARELARSEVVAARGEELPRRIPARQADTRLQLID